MNDHKALGVHLQDMRRSWHYRLSQLDRPGRA